MSLEQRDSRISFFFLESQFRSGETKNKQTKKQKKPCSRFVVSALRPFPPLCALVACLLGSVVLHSARCAARAVFSLCCSVVSCSMCASRVSLSTNVFIATHSSRLLSCARFFAQTATITAPYFQTFSSIRFSSSPALSIVIDWSRGDGPKAS